ncbi:hypothetical protein IMX07_07325 [bacterium]|nr:hypothetical protein [bacterium]
MVGPILMLAGLEQLSAGARIAWAIDNNLTQRLALRDPVAVTRFKTLAAGFLYAWNDSTVSFYGYGA